MADMVDKLLEQSLAAQGNPSPSDQGGGDAGAGESPSSGGREDAKRSARTRIQELANKYRDKEEENARLKGKLEAYEQARMGPTSEVPFSQLRSWDDATDQQLHQIMDAPADDPKFGALRQQAADELRRRETDKRIDSLVEERFSKRLGKEEAQRRASGIFQGLQNRFGESLTNEDSTLRRGAEAHYDALKAEFKDDASDALLQSLAVHMSNGDIADNERRELESLRAWRKQQEAIEAGGGADVSPVPDHRQEMIDKGDTRGAIEDIANRLFPELKPKRGRF